MTAPRVTVLLAVKDGEPWIGRAVRSVLDQTFTDFELLAIDDASSDSTVRTIGGFRDPRVRVLRNERNLGQAPSLNRGLAEARGVYVARLDHDDWCLPKRLERQVGVLDADPRVGLVGTWLRLVDEHDRPVGRMHAELRDLPDFLYETLVMNVLISHPASMFRREAAVAAGGYEPDYAPAEDKDLWRKLALAGWDARIVPEELVVYRLHGGQLSQVQAAHQRTVDDASQERFLGALAADAPVRAVRQLLADDPAFWLEHEAQGDVQPVIDGVEDVLVGLRHRLDLDAMQAAMLEQRVHARIAAVARSGWRHDPNRWRTIAPAFGPLPTGLALTAPAAFAALRAGGVVARAFARSPVLRALRAPARRSRLVRAVYSRLVGAR